MIPNSKLILGPPGCGKTHTLIQHVREALAEGVSPERIGVVSFTRKAIGEFVDRACLEFQLEEKDFPYFRTMHSTAFRALALQTSDVFGRQDYRILGAQLGLDLQGTDRTSPDDGVIIPTVGGSGSKYLQMITRSVYREVSLEQEYNYTGDHSLYFEKLVQISEQLKIYKSAFKKLDFADMIIEYVRSITPVSLDLLIVDEAQDLTPLQWTMAEKMAEEADRVIIAGDDDQAIHRWTGVNVNRFIKCSKDIEVLEQSFRLPRSVWEIATSISRRIPGRIQKDFYPKEEEGRVGWVQRIGDLPLHSGSWTIMARTNSFVRDFAEDLRLLGYWFSIKGKSPLMESQIEVMNMWQRLQDGEAVGVEQVKFFYKHVSKTTKKVKAPHIVGDDDMAVVGRGSLNLLEAVDPTAKLDYDTLVKEYCLVAPLDRNARDIAKVSPEDRAYIAAVERRGESIESIPRIKLSTIHAMKGGEDENVAVYTGSSFPCVHSRHPEDEHRIFYVGITRAKKNLFIIESDKKYRYEI